LRVIHQVLKCWSVLHSTKLPEIQGNRCTTKKVVSKSDKWPNQNFNGYRIEVK
jgi:hypothetical protein